MRPSRPTRPTKKLAFTALSLSVLAACSTLPLSIDRAATAPLLDGFGATTLIPSQGNDGARRLFAQGMAQAYAFNRPEAIRAFKAALAKDPDCSLCAWGIAQQMGPNINDPRRGDLRVAIQYVDYALKHSNGASARDVALIESLALRYGHDIGRAIAPPTGEICRSGGDPGEPANPLDLAYASHMQTLAARYPGDPDILAAYAEAELVATTRGDWWDPKTGKPNGRVGEVADLLEAALARHPDHVGLNHYMIHAVDAVPVASRAVAAADRLGALAPKSPHLLHMPSHTYANVGRYADATRVNQLAVAADESMMAELKKQDFSVTFDWRGHNTHFQWYGALMEGRGELALETARTVAGRAKGDGEYSEYIRSLPMLTLLHLQRWDALLKEPLPTGDKGIAIIYGQMTRGVALARSGKLDDAKAALAKIEPQVKALGARMKSQDRYDKLIRSLAQSAAAQLGAEIALAAQRPEEAIKLQAQAALAADDAERAEPPMLAGGPRQRLGAMQLQFKRHADAEQSFRQDLALHPLNGWALHGLEKALAAQGKQAEAQTAQRSLATSWVLADSQLKTAR